LFATIRNCCSESKHISSARNFPPVEIICVGVVSEQFKSKTLPSPSRRHRALAQCYRQEFPDLLDLLAVCVDAGLSLEAAFERVTGEISKRSVRCPGGDATRSGCR
jgi:hypothetical protein